tara:strand:- start:12 stop:872 length:861 start_codon:yes stop_codon:yes gene_type:complete
MKGIILAGGMGTRLYPITLSTSKQLLPIYDKPLIYYPLTTLINMGIKDIRVITTKHCKKDFVKLLGNGKKWGIKISYTIQKKPEGLPQAFTLCKNFIKNEITCLILGDNIFHSNTISSGLEENILNKTGSIIFTYKVSDPERYGVINKKGEKIISIAEKPKVAKSNEAITGLYIFDPTVANKSKSLRPSKRGEFEITDLIKLYLNEKTLKIIELEEGSAWLDTGTFESMNEASGFIRTLEKRQGIKIGCPEEASFKNGYINKKQLKFLLKSYPDNSYKKYLYSLLK